MLPLSLQAPSSQCSIFNKSQGEVSRNGFSQPLGVGWDGGVPVPRILGVLAKGSGPWARGPWAHGPRAQWAHGPLSAEGPGHVCECTGAALVSPLVHA